MRGNREAMLRDDRVRVVLQQLPGMYNLRTELIPKSL